MPYYRRVYQYIFIFFCCLAVSAVACAEGTGMNGLENITAADWQSLQGVSMYFGHQSVGENILDGVELIKKEYPKIKLEIQKGYTKDKVRPGVLLQSKIGNNGDPLSKINAFKKLMDDGLGGFVNVAFFKFCYIDFTARTNPVAIFDRYKAVIDALQNVYPETLFIHATVPLVSIQRGPKAWIKKVLGRSPDGVNDDIVRNRYNELLRSAYGDQVVVDIALAESTKKDGSLESFTKGGNTYYAMVPDYTSDGGHLNATGRKHVAGIFLEALIKGAVLQSGGK